MGHPIKFKFQIKEFSSISISHAIFTLKSYPLLSEIELLTELPVLSPPPPNLATLLWWEVHPCKKRRGSLIQESFLFELLQGQPSLRPHQNPRDSLPWPLFILLTDTY